MCQSHPLLCGAADQIWATSSCSLDTPFSASGQCNTDTPTHRHSCHRSDYLASSCRCYKQTSQLPPVGLAVESERGWACKACGPYSWYRPAREHMAIVDTAESHNDSSCCWLRQCGRGTGTGLPQATANTASQLTITPVYFLAEQTVRVCSRS